MIEVEDGDEDGWMGFMVRRRWRDGDYIDNDEDDEWQSL